MGLFAVAVGLLFAGCSCLVVGCSCWAVARCYYHWAFHFQTESVLAVPVLAAAAAVLAAAEPAVGHHTDYFQTE